METSGKKYSLVFVLGAGASAPYKLPTGSELKEWIVREPDKYPRLVVNPLRQPSLVERCRTLARRLSGSGLQSVDSFLEARDNEDEQVLGKHMIAASLLPAEAAAADSVLGADWYAWLFQQLIVVKEKRIDFSGVHFVTFNYDRTLEMAMGAMAFNAFGLTPEQASSVANGVPITHVYGKLAAPLEFHDNFGRFRVTLGENAVSASAAQIDIVEAGRSRPDAPGVVEARGIVRSAHRVVFLGFGYDPTNLLRIGVDPSDKAWNRNGIRAFGSVTGMSVNEINSVRRRVGASIVTGLRDHKCLEFLRENIPLRDLIAQDRRTKSLRSSQPAADIDAPSPDVNMAT